MLVVTEVGELKMGDVMCWEVGVNGGWNLEEVEKPLIYMHKHEPQHGEEVNTDTLIPWHGLSVIA